MREQLIQYVKLLFAGTPNSYDMQQEILQNTLDKYDDLISQGKTPEAAYRLAISGIGDISEILGSDPAPTTPPATSLSPQPEQTNKKKWMRAVAIGMYICCVIPLFIFGNIGNGVLGLCLMFVMIAAATVLIIMASNGSKDDDDEEKKESDRYQQKHPLYKTYKSISGWLTLGIYLVVSFATGAWYITWLIFPISACIDSVIKAILDLQEVHKP